MDQCSVHWFFCHLVTKKSGNCHHPPDLQKKSCDKRKWKIVDGKSQMLIEGEPRSAGTQTTTSSFQRKLVLKLALYNREKWFRITKKSLFKLGFHGKLNSCIQSFQQTFGFSMFLRSDLNCWSAPLRSWHARPSTTKKFFLYYKNCSLLFNP